MTSVYMSLKQALVPRDEDMQETKEHTRISCRTRSGSSKGTRSFKYCKRESRASEKTPATVNSAGNDYLKQTFEKVLASKVGCILKTYVSPEVKDATYLYESASNYFRLMCKPFDMTPTGYFELDAFNIYHVLRENIPGAIGINFEEWGGKLSIVLFDDDIKFPDYTLFYIPVCGIENMSEQLRTVFLHFLSFIRQTQKIDIPCESMDFDYIVTEYGEEYEEDMEKEILEMRKRYDTGDIKLIMEDISNTKIIESDLESELNKLLVEDTDHVDEGLISVMLAGVRLLRQDCIFNYDYYPGSNEYDEHDGHEGVTDFDRSFCFCWGNEENDPVVQMAIEFFNNDQQEMETYGPTAFTKLTPNTDCLFEKSDFPTRFGIWYMEFYGELENYMSDGAKNE